jgi:hypothetical protein
LSEFKNKLREDYQMMHDKNIKVCVSGLTQKRINFEEFLSKQWGDGYIYMIEFTDNIKAIKNLKTLDTYEVKHELLEFLFDSENKNGGPHKIEIFKNDTHQLNDFTEHTLDVFLESTKEIRQSRAHDFSKMYRSLSKSKAPKVQLKQNIKK